MFFSANSFAKAIDWDGILSTPSDIRIIFLLPKELSNKYCAFFNPANTYVPPESCNFDILLVMFASTSPSTPNGEIVYAAWLNATTPTLSYRLNPFIISKASDFSTSTFLSELLLLKSCPVLSDISRTITMLVTNSPPRPASPTLTGRIVSNKELV